MAEEATIPRTDGTGAPAPRGAPCEIRVAGPLLGADGRLVSAGWARAPLLRFDARAVRAALGLARGTLRLKQWDYWGVLGPDAFFSTVVADAGFAGVAWVQLVDLAAGTVRAERIAATPLGVGCTLSGEDGAAAAFRGPGAEVSITAGRGGERVVRARFRRFPWEEALEAELVIDETAGAGSIATATPLGAGGWYYNHKRGGMGTSGSVRIGRRAWTFDAATASATLDWGRGVWPYRTSWIWATGWSRERGRSIGLNLGRLGEASGADGGAEVGQAENCVFVDGRLHRVGPFDLEHDLGDPLRPWRFRSRDGRLDVVFTPRLELARRVELLLVASRLHQLLGTFSGTALTDGGERLSLDGLHGWAEDHRARW
jgi:hypothetical protein